MPKQAQKLSPAGRELRGALAVYLAPRMAADQKLPDIGGILTGAPITNRVMQTTGIVTALKTAITGKLAKDADIDDVVDVIQAAERVIEEAQKAEGEDEIEPNAAMPMVAEPEDEDDDNDANGEDKEEHPIVAKVRAFCKEKMSPEDCAKLDELIGEELRAHDEEIEKKAKNGMPENAVTKEAMDEAIRVALRANDAKHTGIAAALAKVRPSVGEIRVACDSAPAVFRKALEMKGIAAKNVPDAGLEAVWDACAAIPKTATPPLAADVALPEGVLPFEQRILGAA